MAPLQITVGSLYMLVSIHYKLKEIRKTPRPCGRDYKSGSVMGLTPFIYAINEL